LVERLRIGLTVAAGVLVVLLAFASAEELDSNASPAQTMMSTVVIPTSQAFNSTSAPAYIIVGGQNGTWGTQTQYPQLYKLTLSNSVYAASLLTVGSTGTVWSGDYNGSTWLISGWGSGKYLNPYITLYNDSLTGKVRLSDYSQIQSEEQEWAGGDVFDVGWNGTAWLLTGLGQGSLYPGDNTTNHMSMAVLSEDGTFTDLSTQIPDQQDMILYANAWNGNYWLVGGGWYGWGEGKLYVLSGDNITDITSEIEKAVPTFNSVQSIAWNGQYFLIGGVGFLAEFDGSTFTDLTPELNQALSPLHILNGTNYNAVNTISWMGETWMLGGGSPVAYYPGVGVRSAWVASFTPGSGAAGLEGSSFADLTSSVLPNYIAQEYNSTILTMACTTSGGCAIGGADTSGGVLLWYDGTNSIDLSATVYANMSYVQWIGLLNS
jgi:hypothetical protein